MADLEEVYLKKGIVHRYLLKHSYDNAKSQNTFTNIARRHFLRSKLRLMKPNIEMDNCFKHISAKKEAVCVCVCVREREGRV